MLSVVERFEAIIIDWVHVGIATISMNMGGYLFDNNYMKIHAVCEYSFSALKKYLFVL